MGAWMESGSVARRQSLNEFIWSQDRIARKETVQSLEEEMKPQRIPNMDSIEKLSKFWDTYDLTDSEDQLEEIRAPVFARRKESTVAVELTLKEAQALSRLAQSEGVEETKLVRKWVREKLRASSCNKERHRNQ